MGLFKKIREHAAISRGDFEALFKEISIPPLPAAAGRLLTEINRPEPEIQQLTEVISTEPELSAKVLRTANSALYSLPGRVTSIDHAVQLIGTRTIRSIALSYVMVENIPKPEGDLFDHEAFWTDSLIRAQCARTLSLSIGAGIQEEAFTAMLLSDLALPVLLCSWERYYKPVIEQWSAGTERLAQIERDSFGWDHAQAGAWILESWGFPEELVCFVASHHLSREDLAELGLEQTVALPVAVSANLPSCLRSEPERVLRFTETAIDWLELDRSEIEEKIADVGEGFEEIRRQFGLPDRGAAAALASLGSTEATAGQREEP